MFRLQRLAKRWLVACVAILFCNPVGSIMADQKHTREGQNEMSAAAVAPAPQESFYFIHWAPGISDMVPQVISDSICAYYDTKLEDSYHLGRVNQHYRLTYMETWQRDRRRADLNLLVGDKPLHAYRIEIVDKDVNQQTPRFFVFDADQKTYHEVDFKSTEGESEYIRLQLRKSLRENDLTLSASFVVQYLAEKVEYSYDENGELKRILRYSKDDNFETPQVFTP